MYIPLALFTKDCHSLGCVFFGEVLLIYTMGFMTIKPPRFGEICHIFFCNLLTSKSKCKKKTSPKESSLPTQIWWGLAVKLQDCTERNHSSSIIHTGQTQLLRCFRPGDDKAFLVFRSLPAPSSAPKVKISQLGNGKIIFNSSKSGGYLGW